MAILQQISPALQTKNTKAILQHLLRRQTGTGKLHPRGQRCRERPREGEAQAEALPDPAQPRKHRRGGSNLSPPHLDTHAPASFSYWPRAAVIPLFNKTSFSDGTRENQKALAEGARIHQLCRRSRASAGRPSPPCQTQAPVLLVGDGGNCFPNIPTASFHPAPRPALLPKLCISSLKANVHIRTWGLGHPRLLLGRCRHRRQEPPLHLFC